MTDYTCPICKSFLSVKFKNQTDINFYKAIGKFDWYVCDYCNTYTIKPDCNDVELGKYYDNNYSPLKYTPKIIDLKHENHPIALRINYLKNLNKKKLSIIDIGCGNGEFLYNVRHYFPESTLYGNDFNIHYTKSNLSEINDINLFEGDFSSIPNNLKFDVISSMQFMEHIQNPFNYVQFIKNQLNINGLIFNDFPNIKSNSFKIFKSNWVHLDTPRHRILYGTKAIDILFNQFELKKFTTFGSSAVYISSILLSFKINIQKIISKKSSRKLFFLLSKMLDLILPKDDKILWIHAKSESLG